MRSLLWMGTLALGLVILVPYSAAACGWCRPRCCAAPPVVCCVVPVPACGVAVGGAWRPAGADAQVGPSRSLHPLQPAAPGRREAELARPNGTGDTPPAPPLPERTLDAGQTPRPALSPRDLPRGMAEPPTNGAVPDGTNVEDVPEQPLENAPAPGGIDLPAAEPQRDEPAVAPNPFDGSRALPTLLPGGLHSRQFRRWADRSGPGYLTGRLIAVQDSSVVLLVENGSIARLSLESMTARDAAFIALQVRAADSVARSRVVPAVAQQKAEHAGGSVLAALDAGRDPHAPVGVAR